MGRRGRPPCPDILTPRQWEVLGLVRRGLSDQEIADALDLTLAGAKYHVSEILTKLSVSSREEAAAWQPAEARQSWWQRALTLSLAAKIAGAAVVLGAAAGIGVLAWGALRSDDSGGTSTAPAVTDLALPPLPTPITPPTLTREQALVKAGLVGDVHAVEMEVTTMEGALSLQPGSYPGGHTSITWVVRYRTFANQCAGLASCGPAPMPPNTSPPLIVACRELTTFFLDGSEPPPGDSAFGPTGGGTGGQPLPDEACKTQSSSDLAVVLSWRQILEKLESYGVPKSVAVKQTSLSEAVDSLRSAGISAEPQQGNGTGDVWLVTISGRLALSTSPTAVPETPQPTSVIPCSLAMAIVSGNTVLAYGSAPSTDC